MANNQNYQYCTGAVYVFAGLARQSFAPVLLGTCDKMPEPQDEWQYEDAMNDLAGRKTPLDRVYAGLLSAISIDFSRYSENALAYLKSVPFYGAADNDGVVTSFGVTSRLARGSFVLQQLNFYSIWLVNDFWLNPQFGGPPDLSPGKYCFACSTLGLQIPQSGTDYKVAHMDIGVLDAWCPNGLGLGSGVPARGFISWTEDPTFFNAQVFSSLLN